MAKKKAATRHRMTKLEKFYIDHHPDSDAKSLAIELGIPEAVIDRYQKKMKREKKKEEQEQKEKPTTTDDFMIKKEDYGVVVMTEAASQQADASRGAGLKSKYYNNAVKKIR
jgi:deoxycytidylate deaminase